MFLNPWAITAGIAAAGLPLAIHWLTRPRPVRLPLSTLRFVQEVVRERRAHYRLRDFLVLALRTLAVCLLALGIARPLWRQQALISADDSGKSLRVVILDASQSLAASPSGAQLFERSRAKAGEFLNYRPDLRANLIVLKASPHALFDQPTDNFSALREELSKLHPAPERAKVQSALNRAGEMLSVGGADVRRELIIISDFQRTNWASADFSALPEQTLIQLESVAPAEPLANLAIRRISSEGRIEIGRDFRVDVEVGNSSLEERTVQVELTLNGAIYSLSGAVPPQSKATLSTDVPISQPGWHFGSARLVDVADALPADDRREFVLEARAVAQVQLVTRQTAQQRPSSRFYLERGLAPVAESQNSTADQVVVIDATAGDLRDQLAQGDVMVLDRPGKLVPETMKLIGSLLRRGRGVLYLLAEPVDAANLQLLQDALGNDLQLPIAFSPAAASHPRQALSLATVAVEQEPLSLFGNDTETLFQSLRFSGGLTSRKVDAGIADDIRMTYSDGSAALVITTCGAGTLALWNADLQNSNLPQSPAFVPLLGELSGLLLGERKIPAAALCSEPVSAFLRADAGSSAGLVLVKPSNVPATWDAGELVDEPVGVLWRQISAGPPGVYQVQRGAQPVFALATAAPAEESELITLPPEVLQGRLAGKRTIHFKSAEQDSDRQDDSWVWLLAACSAAMCLEWGVLTGFRT